MGTSTANLGSRMVVGGQLVPAEGGETFPTFDPSTGEHVADVAAGKSPDVECAVASARQAAHEAFAEGALGERVRLLHAIAATVRRNAVELEELDERTAGLPSRMAKADVETTARYFEFYAGIADKLNGESIPLGPHFVDYTEREPWGVCGIIPPFNVPLQLTARSLAPALAAGNAAVIKPAEQAPLLGLRLGELILELGAPRGLVNVVTGTGPEAGSALVASPDVDHVTFTGSLAVGQTIMRNAADQLTPVTLELGGKSPQIVFADADLDAAAAAICGSALYTAGQVCSAGTRVLVEEAVHDRLVERLRQVAGAIEIGRAVDGPDMGPLIGRAEQTRVLAAIERAIGDGARPVCGGSAPDGELSSGFFVQPTVLDEVSEGMAVAREEIFGPVLAVMRIAGEANAIELANDSEFGLVAGVWTRDLGRAHRVARAVKAGQVFVNNYGVGGGIELPFGGYRKSGIGREKGVAAIHEYTQLKNVCVAIRE